MTERRPAEAELIRCVAEGRECRLGDRAEGDRVVSADLLAELCRSGDRSVHAKGIHVTGGTIDGQVDLEFASVPFPLRLIDCDVPGGMRLAEASIPFLMLNDCRIGDHLSLYGLRSRRLRLHRVIIDRSLNLGEAVIDGNVELVHASVLGADDRGRSVQAQGLRVTGAVLFRSAVAGVVDLLGASVTGNLEMSETKLQGMGPSGCSLVLTRAEIGGGLFLRRGFSCLGAVDAERASIRGEFQLRDAHLGTDLQAGTALRASGIEVGGALEAAGLKASGAVRLSDAVIGGTLDLRGAQLGGAVDEYGNSFVADGVRVGRSVHLSEGFSAVGEVRLVGAAIDGQLSFIGAEPFPVLALRGARCAELEDTKASWPEAGKLELRGFRFGALKRSGGWQERLEWVRRQGSTYWSPDPYEQLAAYYRATGDEDAVRDVQIAKSSDGLDHRRATRGWRSLPYWAWRRGLGWLVGYGYRRHRAAWFLVGVILAAGLVFHVAENDGAMVPDEAAGAGVGCGVDHPCFNSWVYGADVVLPIIDFGQDTAWRPVESDDAGPGWIWARWAFIALGWVLASVFVAAFTGVVQKA